MPLVPRALKPSVLVRRNALYKGVLGGSRGWLAIGAVLWSKSFIKKTFFMRLSISHQSCIFIICISKFFFFLNFFI